MVPQQLTTPNGVEYYKIDAIRYVVHFLAAPFRDRREDETYAAWSDAHVEHARKVFRGNRYRAKWYGGGIVFTTHAGERGAGDMIDAWIAEASR